MSHSPVASHLGIPLAEYDLRIVTFLEHYDVMLDEAAASVAALSRPNPILLDLGIGSGALTLRCIRACKPGRVIGIDADDEMLTIARSRLEGSTGDAVLELRSGNYLEMNLPRCDAIVASFSLHHIRSIRAKRKLYVRSRQALRPGGGLVIADCFLPASPVLERQGREKWMRHLRQVYSPDEADAYMRSWAEEDTYLRLVDELRWLQEAGFNPDVVWREDLFAVVACTWPPAPITVSN